jgi:hypothetical protein
MKKLRLRVDELRIEQFQIESAAAGTRGTVHGRGDTDGQCTGGCTAVQCTQYFGNSMNANTAPCLFCPEMPITYSCEATGCC